MLNELARARQLVTGGHRNAVAEISAINVPGRFIELRHRAGYGSRKAVADEQRNQFDNPKNSGQQEKKDFGRGSEITAGIEQALAELGIAGLYS